MLAIILPSIDKKALSYVRSEYKPHKVDTDSHSIDAVIFTALTY